MRSLSLKVDVCTHDGMRDGVPRLLDLFARRGVRASFFLSFGPDNSGRAVLGLLRPGFLKKMVRTSAVSLYGPRTLLSGTLLPARRTASRYPDLVRRIEAEGHEVAVHAWDHRRWQDSIERMGEAAIREELERAFSSFERILRRRPAAAGAPAWRVTPRSLRVQDRLGLAYASDLRGGPPCLLSLGDAVLGTPQIPTTGPCLEELLTLGVRDEEELAGALLRRAALPETSVLAVHAEVEGGPFLDFFDRLLPRLQAGCDVVRPLEEVAAELEDPPVLRLASRRLPGRSGLVSTAS